MVPWQEARLKSLTGYTSMSDDTSTHGWHVTWATVSASSNYLTSPEEIRRRTLARRAENFHRRYECRRKASPPPKVRLPQPPPIEMPAKRVRQLAMREKDKP
jgi:hypothetical protein